MRYRDLIESPELHIRAEDTMIIASLGGQDVAWFSIDLHQPGFVSLHANVDAMVRRQGITSRVYDWAEHFFRNRKLVPFSRLSPEAYALWQKRDPDAVADYYRNGANWFAPTGLNENLHDDVVAASKRHLNYEPSMYANDAESWYGTKDVPELIAIISHDINKLFSGGSAIIHRIINVPDEVIANLKQGDTLGPLDMSIPASWTTQWDEMEFTALHIYSIHENLDNYFVIESEVPMSAVDVPLTIAQNIALHWEKEITLKRGQPIQLRSIHRAEPYGGLGERVRADLNGAQMRS